MPTLFIKEARFLVSEKGRLRVLREKRKNVHAGVRGYLTFDSTLNVRDFTQQVSYNPYKNETFVSKKRGAIHSAAIAYLADKNVWI